MRRILVVSLALSLAAGPAVSAPLGSIRGTVVDPSGAVVPGVRVTLVLPVGSRTTVTNAQGAFQFGGVAAGRHRLRTELPGFSAIEVEVVVSAGRGVPLRLQLQVAALTETVTVAAAAPRVSRSSAAKAMSGPREEMNTEAYRRIDESAFASPLDRPLSTVSIDVDTAAYANVRRFLLDENRLPPPDAVRIEEMLNYFRYSYDAPSGAHPLAVSTEIAECPWAPDHVLVRIGLQARPVDRRSTPPRNLVFLVDVSGSMDSPDKLPLVKAGLRLLASQLGPKDSVAIVVCAGASYVDSIAEARKVLVTEGGGTLVTVARDVKVQVEWNPARVEKYRLIGYENRLLADEAFEADEVDAGEAGAGHSVTFLYEAVPARGEAASARGLRYQTPRRLSSASRSDELLSVKVRYKPAAGGPSRSLDEPLRVTDVKGEGSTDLRFSAAVAALGLLLRDSEWKGEADYALVTRLATEGQVEGDDARKQFLDLVARAQALASARSAEVSR